VNEILLALGLVAPEYSERVAVNAAYSLLSKEDAAPQKCCGLCKNGKIKHGDGHLTNCPCPDTCECKAVKHDPVILPPKNPILKSVLVPECKDCKPAK